MPVFVHLTPARYSECIGKSGVKVGRGGVFYLRVSANYFISHHWLREIVDARLRRSRARWRTARGLGC
jgi:hypothetical protein